MKTIEELRTERKRRGISQWLLAVQVGRTGPWLSMRERGYVPTTAEELEILEAALRRAVCRKEAADACQG